jgi:CheY-like chemotaxis protein
MDILIIDDDGDTREMVSLILQGDGHNVEEASDGIEALDLLRGGSQPSLILLDMMMPRLDGEGVLTALRGELNLPGTAVYILSGHSSLREKACQLGASGWLAKPVELDRLLEVVRASHR